MKAIPLNTKVSILNNGQTLSGTLKATYVEPENGEIFHVIQLINSDRFYSQDKSIFVRLLVAHSDTVTIQAARN